MGGRLSGASADVYTALSPLGQQALPCEFHNATAGEIADAAGAAARAFRSYRRQPPAERAAFLRQIGAEIEGLGEALIERAHEETGLPLPRLRNERARTVDQLKKFARFVEEGSWVHAHSVVGSGVNIRRMQASRRRCRRRRLRPQVGCVPAGLLVVRRTARGQGTT